MFEIILWGLLILVAVTVLQIALIVIFAKEVPEDVFEERYSYYKTENPNEQSGL